MRSGGRFFDAFAMGSRRADVGNACAIAIAKQTSFVGTWQVAGLAECAALPGCSAGSGAELMGAPSPQAVSQRRLGPNDASQQLVQPCGEEPRPQARARALRCRRKGFIEAKGEHDDEWYSSSSSSSSCD